VWRHVQNGVLVTPVVGVLSPRFSLKNVHPNPREVADVFSVPLTLFLSDANHGYEDRMYGELKARVHFFRNAKHPVWGLTAHVLIDIARLAYGKEPDFQVQCDPQERYRSSHSPH
jgi:hypothetical protein